MIGTGASGIRCKMVLYMWSYLLLFYSCLSVSVKSLPTNNNQGVREYCYKDIFFEPRCGSKEVIILKNSHYGRMRKGGCITDDLGSIGCSVDTLGLLDSKCSGRRSCQVTIPQIEDEIVSSCPNGLRMYLEVEYECVNVAYPPRGYCDTNSPTKIQEQEGYLSSLITQETGCGSKDTPWRLQAKPGQQFRITFWNFDYDTLSTQPYSSDECDAYVSLEEPIKNTQGRKCSKGPRENIVYDSKTSIIDVRLVTTGERHGKNAYFLVEYKAYGCADRQPPVIGWMRRQGNDLYFGCNETSHQSIINQWQMQCNGTHWIGPENNCTAIPPTTTNVPERTTTQQNIPQSTWIGADGALSIVVITGLAVVVCLCLALSCMAVYICRHRRRKQSARDLTYEPDCNSHSCGTNQRTSMKDDATAGSAVETDHYWTWQKQQLDPHRNNFDTAKRSQHGTLTSNHRRSPEESTMLVRKVEDGRGRHGNGRKVPDYDKLDPEFMEVTRVEDVNINTSA